MNKINFNSKILKRQKNKFKIKKFNKNSTVIDNDYIILLGNLKKSNHSDNIKIKELLKFLNKKNIIKFSISTYDIGIGNALLSSILLCNNISGMNIYIKSSNSIEDLLFGDKFNNYIIFLSEEYIFDIQKYSNTDKISCLTIGKVTNENHLIINDGLVNIDINKL